MNYQHHQPGVLVSPDLGLVSFYGPRAARLDRRADMALSEGQHVVAERLSTLAAELRARVAPEITQ